MILTYQEFFEETGVGLEQKEFERLLKDSILEINRYTFGRVERDWQNLPEWIRVKVKRATVELIQELQKNQGDNKKVISESVGSHSVTYQYGEEAGLVNVINKHLFDTGLTYRGLRNGR